MNESNVKFTRDEALDFHSRGRPGKIEIVATKPMATQRDLSLAYSPGVAVPVEAVPDDRTVAEEGQVEEAAARGARQCPDEFPFLEVVDLDRVARVEGGSRTVRAEGGQAGTTADGPRPHGRLPREIPDDRLRAKRVLSGGAAFLAQTHNTAPVRQEVRGEQLRDG